MNDITAIFAFLKYCLESKEDMSRVITGMDWQELYSFASKQALLGLVLRVLRDWERSILRS